MATVLETPFTRSLLTQKCVERFLKMNQGDTVTWQELSRILGGDSQAERRHLVNSARRHLLHAEKMVLECVTGIGVKWLNDGEVPATGQKALKKMSRMCRRGRKKLLTVEDPSKLTLEQRIDHETALSRLAFVEAETNAKAWNRSQQVIIANSQPPRIEGDMSQFKGS